MCMSLLSAPRKRWGLHFLRNVGEVSAEEVSKGMEENAAKAGKKTFGEDILLKPPKSKCWLVAGEGLKMPHIVQKARMLFQIKISTPSICMTPCNP